jgi:replication factor C subunit 3/5
MPLEKRCDTKNVLVTKNLSLSNQLWVEKYRPKTLEKITAHVDIVATIRQLTRDKKLPHLLLYGPPGTGKTSIIIALARELYSTSFAQMTLELNASDDRGIDIVREEIQAFASTLSALSASSFGFKLVILDESDSMTKDAQFALRRIIERYTKYTRFCLICNFPSKIIPALQSRCTKFRLSALKFEDIKNTIQHVSSQEDLNVTEKGIVAVCTVGCGDMRKSLNILQSAHLASLARKNIIDEDLVYAVTGKPLPGNIGNLCDSLLALPFKEAVLSLVERKKIEGLTLSDIVEAMVAYVSQLNVSSFFRIKFLKQISETDRCMTCAMGERLQLLTIVSIFSKLKSQANINNKI